VTIREQVFPSLPLIYSTEITNVVRGTSYDQINKNEEDINLASSNNYLDSLGEIWRGSCFTREDGRSQFQSSGSKK